MNSVSRNTNDILNDLAGFYGFTKDREIARKLGISPATVSNWRRRNTYDVEIIVRNCPGLDINRLLRGLPLTSDENNTGAETSSKNEARVLHKLIQEKDKVIIDLAEQLGQLKEQIKQTKGT